MFDEFLQNEVKENVYHNKSNDKIKKEKKAIEEEENRFLTKAEIALKKKKARDKAFWDKRIKD
ncbi:hypothetical protein [Sharpea azabuensis]|uniref:hypothetical protein n=1 Tax=Sharpea azabuensis TaxID=322505 RepID=UPI00156A045B|nr:hypothetical protein [Sharpea azabuensis]